MLKWTAGIVIVALVGGGMLHAPNLFSRRGPLLESDSSVSEVRTAYRPFVPESAAIDLAARTRQAMDPSAGQSWAANDVLNVHRAAPGDVLTHEVFVSVESPDVEWLETRVSCSCVETVADVVETAEGRQARLRIVWRIKEDALYAFVRGENRLGVECIGQLRDGERHLQCRLGIETSVTPRLSIAPRSLNPPENGRPVELKITRQNLAEELFSACHLRVPNGVRFELVEQSPDVQRFVLDFSDYPGRTGTLQVICEDRSWPVPFTAADPLGIDLARTVFLEPANVRETKCVEAICKMPADCVLEDEAEVVANGQAVGIVPVEMSGNYLVCDLTPVASDNSPIWAARNFEVRVTARRGEQSGQKRIQCWWRK